MVAKHWVADEDLGSIEIDDLDLFQLDDLVGRHKRVACVPVGLANILGCFNPQLFVDSKFLGDLLRLFLKYLLLNANKIGISCESGTLTSETNLINGDVNSVPGREQNLAVGTVSRFVRGDRSVCGFRPGSERQAVDTSELEERAVVGLILRLNSLCTSKVC
jgi:hypothetical protein